MLGHSSIGAKFANFFENYFLILQSSLQMQIIFSDKYKEF